MTDEPIQMSREDFAIFEHDFDVAVEFMDQVVRAKTAGHEPPGYHDVERQVDERRRQDRRLEKEETQDRT